MRIDTLSKVAIIIIAHKPKLDIYEHISLSQCNSVLSNYDTILVCPLDMSVSSYKEVIPDLKFQRVKDKWLNSYRAFNQLKLSPDFYKHFLKYKYILFYELDAFVFKDDLEKWCSLGYDYIGAPWFEGYHKSFLTDDLIGVGNGGFSLRKVKTFYYASKIVHWIRPSLKKLNVQEDLYWMNHIAPLIPFFKIPTKEKALNFAFELHPRKCYELNNHELPFGAHAWYKYDLEFWKPFIEAEGYQI